MRCQIPRKYHELLKEGHSKAAGTAVERQARWSTDPKSGAGYNAAYKTFQRGFGEVKLAPPLLAAVTNAGLTNFNFKPSTNSGLFGQKPVYGLVEGVAVHEGGRAASARREMTPRSRSRQRRTALRTADKEGSASLSTLRDVGLHVAQARTFHLQPPWTSASSPPTPTYLVLAFVQLSTHKIFYVLRRLSRTFGRNVSADEMRGVKDQSIGMLAIAFAILISTIIGATNVRSGQIVTSFHAAVILDLSWMNNTSTWIWFLLYAHHLTKPGEETEPNGKPKREPILASWLAWTGVLLSPVRRLVTDGSKTGPDGAGNAEKSTSGGDRVRVGKRRKELELPLFDVPGTSYPKHLFLPSVPSTCHSWVPSVYGCGAIHPSSRHHGPSPDLESGTQGYNPPSGRFSPAEPAPVPSENHTAFLIVGLVCLAVINIILLVDVELTLLRNKYNQSREEDEWGFGQVLALLLLVVPLRDFATSIVDIRKNVQEKRAGEEKTQRAFEEHLRQSVKDDTCETQIFKDLIKRGADPNVELKDDLHVKALLQLAAYMGNEDLVRYLQGKDVEDKGGSAFYAAVRNKQFGAAYLLKDGNKSNMLQTIRRTFALVMKLVESSDDNVRRAAISCLSSLGAQAELQQEIRPAISGVVKLLEDSNEDLCRAAMSCLSSLGAQGVYFLVHLEPFAPLRPLPSGVTAGDPDIRWAAIQCLSSLGAQAELRQEIRPAISGVVKLLGDFIILGAQAEFQQEIRPAIFRVVKLLEDSNEHVPELQQEIRPAISGIVKLLEDSNEGVRWAVIKCLSSLGAQAELQEEIRPAISRVVKLLDHSNKDVRRAAIQCLSNLGAQAELQQEIRPAISGVVKLLGDSNMDVHQDTIQCLSSLGAQAELQLEIRSAISRISKLLGDSNINVRRAAIQCLSSLGAQAELQQEIRPAIFRVVKLLEDSNEHVPELQQEIRPAISRVVKLLEDSNEHVLSEHKVHIPLSIWSPSPHRGCFPAELQQDIRPAISRVVKLLEDSNKDVRRAVIKCLSSLGAQGRSVELQQEIRPVIPQVLKLLEEDNNDVRRAVISYLSGLGAQDSQILLLTLCDWTPPNPEWTGILESLPRIIDSLLK
ncbi:armadillo-type protein [Mycena leptocephala]|nr:armadillo-type protein [Mycena leptocephala]